MNDWDCEYSWDFSKEWDEEPLIEHRKADVCPLCHLKPCVPWCYNARGVPLEIPEERGRRDLE